VSQHDAPTPDPWARSKRAYHRDYPRLETIQGVPIFMHTKNCVDARCDYDCNPCGWEQAETLAARMAFDVTSPCDRQKPARINGRPARCSS
jgi:hypothetical protein